MTSVFFNFRFSSTFLVLFLLIILAGCAEKPNSVGNDLTKGDFDVVVLHDTLYTTQESSYRMAFPLGGSQTNLTGRLSATEELVTLINFTPGTSIDSLKNAVIDTVQLTVTVRYRYFPAAAPLTFNIQEVTSPWSNVTFTSDSMAALTVGATVLGSFNDSMNFAARPSALISDTSAVRRWAQSFYDTSAAAPEFHGFAIRAPLGVTTGVIGLSSFNNFVSFAPTLLIRYTKNGRRDSLLYSNGEDTYGALVTGVPVIDPITVRGGFGYRSKVYFNHRLLQDTVNTVNKSIVNRAVFEMTLDTAKSLFGGYSPDSLTAFLGRSDSAFDLSDSSLFVYGFRKSVAAGQPPVYAFEVTHIVDRWVQDLNPNYGMTLRWAAEPGTAEKAVFYSRTDAVKSRQPKLIITYSKKL